MVADFRTRPLDAGPYLYMSADALTIKVREGAPGGENLGPAGDRHQR